MEDKEDLIYDLCVNNTIDDAISNLENEFGKNNVKFVDEEIDGVDNENSTDDETYYVKMRSYDVDEFYVRIYYSEYDEIVGDTICS